MNSMLTIISLRGERTKKRRMTYKTKNKTKKHSSYTKAGPSKAFPKTIHPPT